MSEGGQLSEGGEVRMKAGRVLKQGQGTWKRCTTSGRTLLGATKAAEASALQATERRVRSCADPLVSLDLSVTGHGLTSLGKASVTPDPLDWASSSLLCQLHERRVPA